MNHPILEAAAEQRLISKKQYQRIADELLGEPNLDAGQLLLSKHYITDEQLFALQSLINPYEEISTGQNLADSYEEDQQDEPVSDAEKAMRLLQSEDDSLAVGEEELKRIYDEELNASRKDVSHQSGQHAKPPQAAPSAHNQHAPTKSAAPTAQSAKPASASAPASPAAPIAPIAPPKPVVTNVEAREALSKIKKLKDLLLIARSWGASDLHICVDKPPFVRMGGEVRYMEMPPLTAEFTEQLNFQLLTQEQREVLCEKLNLDFALQLEGIGRHRCNVFHQRLGWNGVYRIIPNVIPTIDGLGLPQVCKDLTDHHQGMVLVTGPKGSGKSTTVAAMINYVNQHREDHIITVILEKAGGKKISKKQLMKKASRAMSSVQAASAPPVPAASVESIESRQTARIATSEQSLGKRKSLRFQRTGQPKIQGHVSSNGDGVIAGRALPHVLRSLFSTETMAAVLATKWLRPGV